ncbi:hypothetical protein, partial [Streptomyces brasiliscabiei]
QENFKHDKPSYSFSNVLRVSLRGFKNLIFHAPNELKPLIELLSRSIAFITTLLPTKPKKVFETL